MTDEKYVRYAVEYAEDDVKYHFVPGHTESLESLYQKAKKTSPSLTFERWLQQCALFARRENRAYQRESYYKETQGIYDQAYIAGIVKYDTQKFPKDQ